MKHIVFFLILSMVLVGCEDKDPPSLIVVTTGEATNITFESANVNVDLSDTKGVKEIGVVYSTDNDFFISHTVKVKESLFTKGDFNLENLLSQTTYYYKGFATDGLKNTVYGKVKGFVTEKSPLSISPSTLKADYIDSEYLFQISSESEWTVTSNQTWCTVNKTSGRGNATITVHVTENKEFQERSAVITVKVENVIQELEIIQSLQPTSLEVSQVFYMAEEEGGDYKLSVKCNKEWNILSDQNWCKVVPDFKNNEVNIQVISNTSLVRSATITVNSGQEERKILLNQTGIEYVDITPSLVLSKLALSLPSEGDKCNFAISCTYDWNVTSDQTWCTVLTSSGKGQSIVDLKVDANPYAFTRFATVTVTSREYSQKLVIVQQGKDARLFYSAYYARTFTEYSNSSGFIFAIDETSGITFSSNREWCHLRGGSIYLDENDFSNPRFSLITVSSKDEDITHILVVQYGVIPEQTSYVPPIEMVYVEGGEFMMGGDGGDQIPKHKVILDDYYIGKYEVSQAEWKAIMGNNPSEHLGDNLPVENILWSKAQEFVTKLSELSGESYRLPTEAEWEYAAKGGNKSKGYSFSGSNNSQEVGKTTEYTTYFAGFFIPNELGIYNMTGNVVEWCSDWYAPYTSDEQYNPQGPKVGTEKVVRGWAENTYRDHINGVHFGRSGFRVVKDVKK